MKKTITYACGHEGIVQLYGKEKEREQKLRWLEMQCLCPDCQKAEHREETQEALHEAEAMHLPVLVGSLKQTEWALRIRSQKIHEAQKICFREDLPKEFRGKARRFYEWYAGHEKAGWWLDHRYESPQATCRFARQDWDT